MANVPNIRPGTITGRLLGNFKDGHGRQKDDTDNELFSIICLSWAIIMPSGRKELHIPLSIPGGVPPRVMGASHHHPRNSLQHLKRGLPKT